MPEETSRASKGGTARAAKLTKEQRSSIAKDAAKKRWANKKTGKSIQEPTSVQTVEILTPTIQTSNEADNPPAPVYVTLPVSNNQHPMPIPAPLTARRRAAGPRAKPRPKEFGKAHSAAEKRLTNAIRERAECMNKLAMLNAEIPSLAQIIRALGATPPPMPMMQNYPMVPQVPQDIPLVNPYENVPGIVDPALFQANSRPLPGLGNPAPNPKFPLIPGGGGGGAMNLDYVPQVEDEASPLPNMGGGWR